MNHVDESLNGVNSQKGKGQMTWTIRVDEAAFAVYPNEYEIWASGVAIDVNRCKLVVKRRALLLT